MFRAQMLGLDGNLSDNFLKNQIVLAMCPYKRNVINIY